AAGMPRLANRSTSAERCGVSVMAAAGGWRAAWADQCTGRYVRRHANSPRIHRAAHSLRAHRAVDIVHRASHASEHSATESSMPAAKHPLLRLPIAAAALSLALAAAPAVAGPGEDARASNAVRVLTDIQAIPESAIPEKLFDEGRAIVVVPDTIKAGLVIGGR